ncbi:MAG TPA: DUF542 domain-containing protein [Trueperaceae bacterium]
MASPLDQITRETSVNRILELAPDAIVVLDEFGIDSCCGGSLSLGEAAQEATVDADLVLSRLTSRYQE